MFFQLLKERRSIRKYQERAVEKEKLDIILKSALLSPSSRSRRPWEFVAVTDKEVLKSFPCAGNTVLHFRRGTFRIVVIADKRYVMCGWRIVQ